MCLTLSSFSVFGFFPMATKNSLGLIHEEHTENSFPSILSGTFNEPVRAFTHTQPSFSDCLQQPDGHFPQPGKGRTITHNVNNCSPLGVTTDVEIKKPQRYYNIYDVTVVLVSKYLPFFEGRSDKGNIRYTLNALFPFFILLSLTSSMSGKEFMAHRKFAFHVLGSGLSTPG